MHVKSSPIHQHHQKKLKTNLSTQPLKASCCSRNSPSLFVTKDNDKGEGSQNVVGSGTGKGVNNETITINDPRAGNPSAKGAQSPTPITSTASTIKQTSAEDATMTKTTPMIIKRPSIVTVVSTGSPSPTSSSNPPKQINKLTTIPQKFTYRNFSSIKTLMKRIQSSSLSSPKKKINNNCYPMISLNKGHGDDSDGDNIFLQGDKINKNRSTTYEKKKKLSEEGKGLKEGQEPSSHEKQAVVVVKKTKDMTTTANATIDNNNNNSSNNNMPNSKSTINPNPKIQPQQKLTSNFSSFIDYNNSRTKFQMYSKNNCQNNLYQNNITQYPSKIQPQPQAQVQPHQQPQAQQSSPPLLPHKKFQSSASSSISKTSYNYYSVFSSPLEKQQQQYVNKKHQEFQKMFNSSKNRIITKGQHDNNVGSNVQAEARTTTTNNNIEGNKQRTKKSSSFVVGSKEKQLLTTIKTTKTTTLIDANNNSKRKCSLDEKDCIDRTDRKEHVDRVDRVYQHQHQNQHQQQHYHRRHNNWKFINSNRKKSLQSQLLLQQQSVKGINNNSSKDNEKNKMQKNNNNEPLQKSHTPTYFYSLQQEKQLTQSQYLQSSTVMQRPIAVKTLEYPYASPKSNKGKALGPGSNKSHPHTHPQQQSFIKAKLRELQEMASQQYMADDTYNLQKMSLLMKKPFIKDMIIIKKNGVRSGASRNSGSRNSNSNKQQQLHQVDILYEEIPNNRKQSLPDEKLAGKGAKDTVIPIITTTTNTTDTAKKDVTNSNKKATIKATTTSKGDLPQMTANNKHIKNINNNNDDDIKQQKKQQAQMPSEKTTSSNETKIIAIKSFKTTKKTGGSSSVAMNNNSNNNNSSNNINNSNNTIDSNGNKKCNSIVQPSPSSPMNTTTTTTSITTTTGGSNSNSNNNKQALKTNMTSTNSRLQSYVSQGQGQGNNRVSQPQTTSKPVFYFSHSQQKQLRVTCKNFIVTEFPSGRIITGSYYKQVSQIASLTKIVTFYCVLLLIQQYELGLDEESIYIDQQVESTGGTSADLLQGDTYTVRQICYGLMLPSGNDAALALAKWGGRVLLRMESGGADREEDKEEKNRTCMSKSKKRMNKEKKEEKPEKKDRKMTPPLSQQKVTPGCSNDAQEEGKDTDKNNGNGNDNNISSEEDDQQISSQQLVKTFMSFLNKTCNQLNMKSSYFGNPHGLPHTKSGTTLQDLSIIINKALSYPFFRQVIKTPKFTCWINQAIQTQKHLTSKFCRRQVVWENTNKLLRRDGFVGIKTGVTVTAGPCLASCYELGDKIYTVVLLKTSKLSKRFKETRWILGKCLGKLYGTATGSKGNIGGTDYRKEIKSMLKNDAEFDSDNSQDEQEFNYERSDAKQMQKRMKIITYEM